RAVVPHRGRHSRHAVDRHHVAGRGPDDLRADRTGNRDEVGTAAAMSVSGMTSTADGITEALLRRFESMTPGEQLPTVRELMASHGVSQFTVQQALNRLKQAGLIDAQVGRGTFL